MSHQILSNYIQNGKYFLSNRTLCVERCSGVGGLSSMTCSFKCYFTITNVLNSLTVKNYTRTNNIKSLRQVLNYLLKPRNISTSPTVLKENNNNTINNKRHTYKQLDVEKLLSGMSNKSKVVSLKDERKSLSKQHQLQQAIQEVVRKLKKDWNSAFRYHALTISLMIFILVPSNILYCWYDPLHREKASTFSPYWGMFLDMILDPLNDDMKQNAGIPVCRADRLENSEFLKNNATSFKESIEKNVGHEKPDITLDKTLSEH